MDIEANDSKENQFFVLMNAADKVVEGQTNADSILMFQFSRPQNLVMYWKFIVPIAHMKFVNVRKMPILLLVDKNSDLQKIYCGVSKAQLKEQAEKRRTTEHKSHAD